MKYLLKQGVVVENSVRLVTALKQATRLPEYVSEKEMLIFLDWEDNEEYEAARDKLIIALLYATGMRRAELINLKHADVDLQQAQIKVLGKGNKERIIPISKRLKNSIKSFNFIKDAFFEHKQTDHLLVTKKGKALYPSLVYNIVKRTLSMITTLNKKSPHILRHTFATHMANNGADLLTIKELLGHASLQSTQVYTHTNIERLKEVYKNAHPASGEPN